MNIREELLKYQVQSKENALRIAEYAVSSEENFMELIDCFTAENVKLAQRAAWSVSWAAKKNPEIVQHHIGLLVSQLTKTNIHDAVIRNSIRILQDMEIPAAFHGELLSACFDFIQKRNTPIAIKAFSLNVLFNLSKIYPEIRNELKMIVLQNIDYETAAFKSRAKKILAKI
ncbi:hypothetical protein [Dyadobacter sp. NIV53]|uniref:hypothetical protein n=1 Tax=Dyadobacter sp. NIV53 TaxID=2861765 RepID=UPI001C868E8A|nr:hypothetical protein [Dyadobacter sp. NIV53]